MKQLTPIFWQKIEGAVLFTASIACVKYTGESWWWLLAILVPDVFMIGYIKSTGLGAFTYNLGYTFIFPLILLLIGLVYSRSLFTVWACIWLAHIGMDRMLGYGLKYDYNFKHTHLGDIGK